MKEARFKNIHTHTNTHYLYVCIASFHLYGILKKAKLQGYRAEQWFSGKGDGERV